MLCNSVSATRIPQRKKHSQRFSLHNDMVINHRTARNTCIYVLVQWLVGKFSKTGIKLEETRKYPHHTFFEIFFSDTVVIFY